MIIIGGGPAGLSGALILSRCRRSVLLFDDGRARNAPSHASHGFFTRDGEHPAEMRRIGREQLRPYGTEIRDETVVDARRTEAGFEVVTAGGQTFRARKLLLATGIRDRVPPVEGFEGFYGTSAWTCPYCDGWEVQDRPLAAYGYGKEGVEFALALTPWSSDLVLLTDGTPAPEPADLRRLELHGIGWRPERIARLEGADGRMERVVFENGNVLARAGLFFHLGVQQQSPLPAKLGCAFNDKGCVLTDYREGTGIPGLYVAGDASHDVLLLPVAVAEGVKAGFAINKELREESSRRLEAQAAKAETPTRPSHTAEHR